MADERNNLNFFWTDTASSTTDGCPTPSSTMFEATLREKKDENLKNTDDSSGSKPDKTEEIKPSHNDHTHHIEHQPIPGRAFMIRTRQQPHRILSLQYGKLQLLHAPMRGSGVFWHCYGVCNWCLLYNITSGTFLSHDGAGKMSATNSSQRVQQYLVPIRQKNGGYILHTFHPEKTELWQVAIADDGNGTSLVEKNTGGTAWDFIDSEYVRCSMSLAFPNMEEEILRPL